MVVLNCTEYFGKLSESNSFDSRSANGEACVEVAGLDSGAAVRDSKDRTGPALAFARGRWAAFLDGVKTGRYDLA